MITISAFGIYKGFSSLFMRPFIKYRLQQLRAHRLDGQLPYTHYRSITQPKIWLWYGKTQYRLIPTCPISNSVIIFAYLYRFGKSIFWENWKSFVFQRFHLYFPNSAFGAAFVKLVSWNLRISLPISICLRLMKSYFHHLFID